MLPTGIPSHHTSAVVRGGLRLARELAFHFHRLRVLRPFPQEVAGPVVLACNHISYLDPVLLQAACPRLISWMIAREYYQRFGVNWVCRKIEAIPVERRGRDMAAMRAALRALEDGRLLGIFPEGRLETSTELLPFQAGIGMLAIHSGATVIPAYIEGTQRNKDLGEVYCSPQSAQICFGPPLRFAESHGERFSPAAATEQVRQAIAELRKQVMGKC